MEFSNYDSCFNKNIIRKIIVSPNQKKKKKTMSGGNESYEMQTEFQELNYGARDSTF
jgi:hypothetical protein